ncbi:MAG: Ni/Fe hydrogenase subunit alpha [gamma proteobacterium symbiont of Bathyaustriella thionipta]|nr:Ni/Fe hydrogenase subunit alpha [gamma proteobacterium symbiont of Bathyaustriella thionipta]
MNDPEILNINVPLLTRVEGEGALDLEIRNEKIESLQLRIFEPPRYFEKFLEGRYYYDVPDVVARICGICPVAYQMSASCAIESAFGMSAHPWIRSMRRLFYCGEWIQSHSLHIHLLALPDFLGEKSVIGLSALYPEVVRRGLELQALGNDLIALFGARSVHPVGAKIGGFFRAPEQGAADKLLRLVEKAYPDAIEMLRWLDTLSLPDDEQSFVSVALRHDSEYPFNEGRLVNDAGLDISIESFESVFIEHQVAHSTALHCLLKGKPYLVGPLARINLNRDRLPAEIQDVMGKLRTRFPSKNMFHSLLARGLEILFCLHEARRLLTNYRPDPSPSMEVTPREGIGFGCTEAPRGILWHRYKLDDRGRVSNARIVPPTSQNQARMEEDLREGLTRFGLHKDADILRQRAESMIRNYDPCISCATHFLDLSLQRKARRELRIPPLRHRFHVNDWSAAAIIAVGSPHAGDTLAWDLCTSMSSNEDFNRLQAKGLTLMTVDRPGLKLLNLLRNYRHILIIDSTAGVEQTAATPQLLQVEELMMEDSVLSSHNLGITIALKLAIQLKNLPEETFVLALSRANEQAREAVLSLFGVG